MAINQCQSTFHELANAVMPSIMKELRQRIKAPIPMAVFGTPGKGKSYILKTLGLKSDFKGCYVLIEKDRPIYVGISQTVVQRLQQHIKGRTHYDASLAYRMAMDKVPHTTTREQAMKNKDFMEAFMQSKNYISGLSVAFIEIENPVELYLFELYCSMELDTGKWNTFETH